MRAAIRSEGHGRAASGGVGFLVLCLFIISAYDIYFQGIGLPLVPLAGTLLLCVHWWSSATVEVDRRRFVATGLALAALTMLTALSGLWGLLYFGSVHAKGPLGVVIGLILLGTTIIAQRERDRLHRALTVVLGIHLVLWATQYGSYLVTGRVVDLLEPITGTATRSDYFGFTRFTGFFTEPAALALFLFMGLSARMLYSGFRPRLLDGLMFFAVITTLSVSGYFLTLALVAVALVRMPPRRAVVLAVVVMAVTLSAVSIATRGNEALLEWVLRRAFDPLSDASGAVRATSVLTRFAEFPDVVRAFGIGVGNYDVFGGAVSGFQNLLEAYGVMGFTVLLTGIAVIFYTAGATPTSFGLWLLSLAATMMWTVPYWWLWTGMLVVFSRRSHRAGDRETPLELAPARA